MKWLILIALIAMAGCADDPDTAELTTTMSATASDTIAPLSAAGVLNEHGWYIPPKQTFGRFKIAWTAPTCGSPVDRYLVQFKADFLVPGNQLEFFAFIDTVSLIGAEYRVAGRDSLGRQGEMSVWGVTGEGVTDTFPAPEFTCD